MKLPKSVRVGYLDYDVCSISDISHRYGELHGLTDNTKHEIHVYQKAAKVEVANTFLHEIMHACFWTYSLKEENEEGIVTVLANALCQVFRDNPEVLDILKEGTSDSNGA